MIITNESLVRQLCGQHGHQIDGTVKYEQLVEATPIAGWIALLRRKYIVASHLLGQLPHLLRVLTFAVHLRNAAVQTLEGHQRGGRRVQTRRIALDVQLSETYKITSIDTVQNMQYFPYTLGL